MKYDRSNDAAVLASAEGMPKKTPDIDDLLRHVDEPNLIPGIYNYCNRRCERCPFTKRCLLFLDLQRDEALQGRDALDQTRDSLQPTSALMEAWCERAGIDFAEIQRDAHSQEVALELRKTDLTSAEPLQKAAETYAHAAWKVIESLNRAAPLVAWPADVGDAIDTIATCCIAVASKTHRALSGLATRDEAFEDSPIQNDWNGSAKVARLLIAESKAAWETLIAIGLAAEDAPIRQMVDLLDRVDAGFGERFPQAMEFVRPGFDEPYVAAGALTTRGPFQPRAR